MIPLPKGVSTADDLLAAFDACWVAGFANLAAAHRQTLGRLANVFAGSPLSPLWSAAVGAIEQGVFQPEHFRVVATARASLQGAQYDLLRRSVQALLQRQPPEEASHGTDRPGLAPLPLMTGAAHWLMDVALQGLGRLSTGELSVFDRTLTQLHFDPAMMPLAALLNGLLHELVGAVPLTAPETAPLFRWIDLWSQAMLLTAAQPPPPVSHPVDGTLYLMGVDRRSQARMVSAVFYGILVHEEASRWVRATFSAYKVSVIRADEAWLLLLPQAERLLLALRDRTALRLKDMPMFASGDLLWQDACASGGPAYDLEQTAGRYLAPGASEPLQLPAIPAERRHPVHLAEPVALSGYRIDDACIEAGGLRLPLDVRRSRDGELDAAALAKFQHAVGLLRYDDQQWRFQPLAATNQRMKHVFVGLEGALELLDTPPKNGTVAVLQERASRLLREK